MKRLLLLALTGCGFVTGDEYRVADPISDDGAAEAAPALDGGHPEASLDGDAESSTCACAVDVPNGWTFVAMGGCEGAYAGGTATFCTEVSGPPVFTCLPLHGLASCEAGLGAPSPASDQILCVQHTGDVPCPNAYFDRHSVYAPTNGCATLANPTTICCAPSACK